MIYLVYGSVLGGLWLSLMRLECSLEKTDFCKCVELTLYRQDIGIDNSLLATAHFVSLEDSYKEANGLFSPPPPPLPPNL